MQPQTNANVTPKPKMPKALKVTLIVSAALWLIACPLVAYQDIASSSWSMSGLASFLWGPFAILGLQFAGFVAWLSNAFVFVAVILLLSRKYRRAIILSAIALTCSVAAFFVTDLPKNEGTSVAAHVSIGPAVYVWLASILAILIGSIVLNKATKKNTAS